MKLYHHIALATCVATASVVALNALIPQQPPVIHPTHHAPVVMVNQLQSVTRTGPADIYPNESLTPGATNPDITQANISENICNKAWSTKSIRPSSSYTTTLKRKQIVEYGFTDTNLKDYEEDHLISLELGGSPTDPKNLWPESYTTTPNARDKDKVENALHVAICNGDLTLKDAQTIIVHDWYAFGRSKGIVK